MSHQLRQMGRLVAERTGLTMGDRQQEWLSAAVERLAREDGRSTSGEDLAAMIAEPGFVERLIDEITIRETFFLRENEQLRSIDWKALLARARATGRERVRVWSAGCSSGEEPYTVAMMAFDALGADPPVSVLGTDIASAALEVALAARYEGRTVKRLTSDRLLRHFHPHERGLVVDPAIRALVHFTRHNLVNDPSPPSGEERFDLILCRNVLIHFDPAAAARAGKGLTAALQPEGTLLLGPADRLCLNGPSLSAMAREDGRRPGRAHSGRPGSARPVRAAPARGAHAPGAGRRAGASASAPRPVESGPRPEELAQAMRLADAGELEAALETVRRAARDSPMSPSVHLLAGIIELALNSPQRAVAALRRALYLDPGFGVAAFYLGRAREGTGDSSGAEQAYDQALHALDPDDGRHAWLVERFELADVAEACKLRLIDLRRR